MIKFPSLLTDIYHNKVINNFNQFINQFNSLIHIKDQIISSYLSSILLETNWYNSNILNQYIWSYTYDILNRIKIKKIVLKLHDIYNCDLFQCYYQAITNDYIEYNYLLHNITIYNITNDITSIISKEYNYNQQYMLKQVIHTANKAHNVSYLYQYDINHYLTTIYVNNTLKEHYIYNNDGNMIKEINQDRTNFYQYNELNQLITKKFISSYVL